MTEDQQTYQRVAIAVATTCLEQAEYLSHKAEKADALLKMAGFSPIVVPPATICRIASQRLIQIAQEELESAGLRSSEQEVALAT